MAETELPDPLDPFGDLDAECELLPPIEREYARLAATAERSARSDFLQLDKRGTKSQPQQGALWRSGDTFARSVAAKLRELGRTDISEELEACHVESWNIRCTGCRKTSKVWNRCDLFFCPRCAPRLANERHDRVKWWASKVSQPKHVVLTVRNTAQLTREHVSEFMAAFTRLRRMVLWSGVRGGFYRVEVTNEGKGWHLHLHALIDGPYLCERQLAIAWGKATRGAGYIVHIRAATGDNYLKEITKYVVKGDQLAEWSGPDIAAFVDAFRGKRTFGVFGSMRGHRAEAKEFHEQQSADRAHCECGCATFEVLSDEALNWREDIVGARPPPTVPVPEDRRQQLFDLVGTRTVRPSAYLTGA